MSKRKASAERPTQTEFARLRAEVVRLREQLSADAPLRRLEEALTLAATASTIGQPVTHTRLLEMIVATAADVIAAESAALFLVDFDRGDLIFKVALGPKAEAAKRLRVPLGHGIAGLVAMSGQPMAVSEAHRDPRLATDIADRVGHVPRSVLCVPLTCGDRIIGVIELLNKIGSAAFSHADLEALGLFANQAAVAIEQSRIQEQLPELLRAVIERGAGDDLRDVVREFVAAHADGEPFRKAIELAELVQQAVHLGDDEALACTAILRVFVDYARRRRQLEPVA